jgi:hypothetical protein
MNKLISILLFTGLFYSCSQPKLLVSYGTEQKFLIYSDSTIANGNITLYIESFVFKFNGNDFEKELTLQLKEYSKMNFDYMHRNFLVSNYQLVISKTDSGMVFNDSTKIKYPLDYSINMILDKLIQDGKFCLFQDDKLVPFIEHIYWEPQFQGTISSKWIVNDKTINEIAHGFVD